MTKKEGREKNMAQENYNKAGDILFQLEGYSSNLKGDTGGRTIWGITEKWYPDEVKVMLNMSSEESKAYAREFYRREFWDKLGCDALEFPLDIIAFCQSVNSFEVAKKILNETKNWKDFLFNFQIYYSKLVEVKPQNKEFFRGWINRTLTLWNKFK